MFPSLQHEPLLNVPRHKLGTGPVTEGQWTLISCHEPVESKHKTEHRQCILSPCYYLFSPIVYS